MPKGERGDIVKAVNLNDMLNQLKFSSGALLRSYWSYGGQGGGQAFCFLSAATMDFKESRAGNKRKAFFNVFLDKLDSAWLIMLKEMTPAFVPFFWNFGRAKEIKGFLAGVKNRINLNLIIQFK